MTESFKPIPRVQRHNVVFHPAACRTCLLESDAPAGMEPVGRMVARSLELPDRSSGEREPARLARGRNSGLARKRDTQHLPNSCGRSPLHNVDTTQTGDPPQAQATEPTFCPSGDEVPPASQARMAAGSGG